MGQKSVSQRTRIYNISCTSYGVPARKLAGALIIYRLATLEAPKNHCRKCTKITKSLSNLPPVTTSEIVKAINAYKRFDDVSKCNAQIEVYSTCDSFNVKYVAPYISLVLLIVFGWITVAVTLPSPKATVPVAAAMWRQK